jgi:uncharacterized membrane protein
MPLPADEYIPQHTRNKWPVLVWLLVSVGALVVSLMIVSAPLAVAGNHNLLAFAIYRTFSSVCHQLPERSFFIAGHQFAVCARCTGLYVGFTLAVLLYPLIRPIRTTVTPARKWLFLAAMPLAVDFGLGFFGVWENTHSSRLLSGLLLGAVSVFYIMPGFAELSLRRWRDSSTVARVTLDTLTTVSENIAAAPSDYSAPQRRI